MKRTIFILFLLLIPILSFTQENEERAKRRINSEWEYSLINPVLENDNVFIEQIGRSNTVEIIQQSSIGNINTNTAVIRQLGLFNQAYVDQFGSDIVTNINQAGMLLSFGVYNRSFVDIAGSNISTTINQFGIGNYVDQKLQGQNLNYYVEQVGGFHKLIHYDNGSIAPTLGIYQYGVGARAIIRSF